MNMIGQPNGNSIVMEFNMESGDVIWTFQENFYGAKQSGAFRLPNGNTFFTAAGEGMFEVTNDGVIVWELSVEDVFRAQKYPSSYLTLFGDINGDGTLNVNDIVLIVNSIMGGVYNANGDINNDNVLNILDIVTISTIILGE